jgi:hypothetical protein
MPVVRNGLRTLESLSRLYPVVTVTGPRQSGKTTLCRAAFPDKAYVSLEPIDTREYANTDPRGFLHEYQAGAILDEIQHAPALLSYLQGAVDEEPAVGRFVLTGSEHFSLSHAISQSLAGRTGILHLLPLSFTELQRFDAAPTSLLDVLWSGSYPRIFDRKIPAHRWLADYVTTYVQRDVRSVLNVADLAAFSSFLRHAAAHTSAELNLSALGAAAGVSHNTARQWLSVLETSFLTFRVLPWHVNIKKQLVKRPKLHFVDSGLVCYLLGIESPEQLRHHPLRGAVFETWVISEVLKNRMHQGLEPRLYYFRQTRGPEVDLVVDRGSELSLLEAKSAETIAGDFFASLLQLRDTLRETGERRAVSCFIAFGGDQKQRRHDVTVLPFPQVDEVGWG